MENFVVECTARLMHCWVRAAVNSRHCIVLNLSSHPETFLAAWQELEFEKLQERLRNLLMERDAAVKVGSLLFGVAAKATVQPLLPHAIGCSGRMCLASLLCWPVVGMFVSTWSM